jgi:hypothetical protein
MGSYLIIAFLLALACVVFGLLRADVSGDDSDPCQTGNCNGCSEHHRCGDDFSFHQPMTDPRKLFRNRD